MEAPPKPPSPGQVAGKAKGMLKGKPAWMWVAGVTVLVGVAYMMWRRQSAPVAGGTPDTSSVDGTPTDASVGPVGGGYAYGDGNVVTPAPTQGAYGGYSQPLDTAGDAPVDSAGQPAPLSTTVVNVTQPAPLPSHLSIDHLPTLHVTQPVTGGGHPRRNPGKEHKAPPKAKHPVHAPKPTHGKSHPAPPKSQAHPKPTRRRRGH